MSGGIMSHCRKGFNERHLNLGPGPMSTTHLFCVPPHLPSFLGSYGNQSLQIYQSMTINKRLIELGTKAQHTENQVFMSVVSQPQPKKKKKEREKKAIGPAEVQHEPQQRRSRLKVPKTMVVNRHGMTMRR